MEPGTLDAIFAYLQECRKSASLSKGSLEQPAGPLPPKQALCPSCPSQTLSRVMHQSHSDSFLRSAFSIA